MRNERLDLHCDVWYFTYFHEHAYFLKVISSVTGLSVSFDDFFVMGENINI